MELTGPSTGPSALRRNVSLTAELAVTSFKLRYTGSVLGYVWSLVKPLMVFGMLYVVFAFFLLRGRTNDLENFPVQLLVGIVVWTFFADGTVAGLHSIVDSSQLVIKTYFPRWIIVLAATLSAAMTLVVNLFLILAVGLPLHWFHVGWYTLWVPILFLELYALVLGFGMLLSSLFVFFRDIGYVWEIGAQFLFYASAIIFPFSLIPSRFSWLVALNPMAQIIEDMRRALVTPVIPWSGTLLGWKLALPVVGACVVLAIGAVTFGRSSRRFGEAL